MARKDDHLSNEVAVGVDVTPTGVNAKAKSRLVSSLDRLLGSFFDQWTAKNERSAEQDRVLGASERQIIRAAARKAVEHIEGDANAAATVLERSLGKSFERLENVGGAAHEAVEDLRQEPPTEEQNTHGPETIAPEVLDRWQRYAEDASTDSLRQKWGKVLAAEVRHPGTVSNKVMRIVDELSPEDAVLFERLNNARLGPDILEALTGELSFLESSRLIGAGLLTDSSLGLSKKMHEIALADGSKRMFATMGTFALAIPLLESEIIARKSDALRTGLTGHGEAALAVEVLTSEGVALASILKDGQEDAFRALLAKVREKIPEAEGWRSRGKDSWRHDKGL